MDVTTSLKHSDDQGRRGRLSDHVGRNASERREGLETCNAEADPPATRGRLSAVGKRATRAPTGSAGVLAAAQVRNAEASTRASRRSSFAPAGEKRSRKRSSCFGFIEWTAKPRSIRLSTTGPRGVSIRHADLARLAGLTRGEGQQPVRHLRQTLAAMLERPFPEHLPDGVEHTRLMLLRTPVDTREPRQLQNDPPPVCRIQRARQRCLPVPVLALNGANSPRGIHRWLTAGAPVPPRCSRHRGQLVAPGGLPDSTRLTARSRSERYRGREKPIARRPGRAPGRFTTTAVLDPTGGGTSAVPGATRAPCGRTCWGARQICEMLLRRRLRLVAPRNLRSGR